MTDTWGDIVATRPKTPIKPWNQGAIDSRRFYARQKFIDAELPYDFTVSQIRELVLCINEELKADYVPMRMSVLDMKDISPRGDIELKVSGPYFSDREAITFNADGLIGFAGWADEVNVEPFIRGFVRWVDWMTNAEPEECRIECQSIRMTMSCPFCGGVSVIAAFDDDGRRQSMYAAHMQYAIQCNQCGAIGPKCDGAADALAWWERRLQS